MPSSAARCGCRWRLGAGAESGRGHPPGELDRFGGLGDFRAGKAAVVEHGQLGDDAVRVGEAEVEDGLAPQCGQPITVLADDLGAGMLEVGEFGGRVEVQAAAEPAPAGAASGQLE